MSNRQYYEDGVGVLPNFPLALEYFGKAASKGYQPAAHKLNRPIPKVAQDEDENEQIYFLKNNNKTNNNSENRCYIQ
jgi:TPR repeat protein